MTDKEAAALVSIARRLLRDGHISIVEADFLQTLVDILAAAPGAPAQGQP